MAIGAAIGSAVIGAGSSYLSSKSQEKAAKTAASAEERAAQMSIDAQQEQFDQMRDLLSPYVEGGYEGLQGQLGLIGLQGNEVQQQAIDSIKSGAEYNSLIQSGEEAILQNASATGNLRGGNVQGALAEYRPQILSSLINQQYSRLGGLTSIGQSSAAGVGNAGMQTAQGISQQYGNMGSAQAGSALASANAQQNLYGGISNSIGQGAGLYSTLLKNTPIDTSTSTGAGAAGGGLLGLSALQGVI